MREEEERRHIQTCTLQEASTPFAASFAMLVRAPFLLAAASVMLLAAAAPAAVHAQSSPQSCSFHRMDFSSVALLTIHRRKASSSVALRAHVCVHMVCVQSTVWSRLQPR